MQRLIGESQQEALTNTLWEQWKSYGYTTQPRALTWMEINNLAGVFLKLCREKQLDYREFDFSTLIDHTLNYDENKSTLYERIGNPYSEEEKEAASKLKDYLTEEELSEYTAKEKTIIETIQTDNQNLNKRISKLTKKVETQTIDPEALKHELEEMNRVQSEIYARLAIVENLPQKKTALLESPNFRDIGKALQTIKPNIKETIIKSLVKRLKEMKVNKL